MTCRMSWMGFLGVALLAPIGLGACAGEVGPAVDETELGLESSGPGDEHEVFVSKVDPAVARQHKEAMSRCLAARGVAMPEGPIRIHFKAPPGEAAGTTHKVLFKVQGPDAQAAGEPADLDEVPPVDEATSKAFAACLAQVGQPGSRRL